MASDDRIDMDELDGLGTRVPFTCPECGGALWEIEDAGGQRFRCHVGHAYAIRSLVVEQATRVEAALWAALRSLEENERLARRMAAGSERRGDRPSAQDHLETAEASAAHAEVLRGFLGQAFKSGGTPSSGINVESEK